VLLWRRRRLIAGERLLLARCLGLLLALLGRARLLLFALLLRCLTSLLRVVSLPALRFALPRHLPLLIGVAALLLALLHRLALLVVALLGSAALRLAFGVLALLITLLRGLPLLLVTLLGSALLALALRFVPGRGSLPALRRIRFTHDRLARFVAIVLSV
jgi:hypothetical protein